MESGQRNEFELTRGPLALSFVRWLRRMSANALFGHPTCRRMSAIRGKAYMTRTNGTACHLSTQRTRLLGELSAHVLRGSARGIRSRSSARACHGSHLHSARGHACISTGIACLWGPAYGGANEGAVNDASGDRHGGPHS